MGELIDLADHAWRRSLKTNKLGAVTAEPGNAFLMLTNDEWAGCLAYDEFADRIFWSKQPPSMPEFAQPTVGEDLRDHHTVYIQHYLSRYAIWHTAFKTTAVNDAVSAAARRNIIHPLRQYLTALTWDGTARLPHWCHDYLGCEDTPYAASVGTWWLISAVARVLQPGCQADHMLLLEGEQGARKSTALRVLAGDWYLPELPDVHTKDAAHALHGRWIVECGELEAMRRSEITAVKDFLTRTVDIYRPAYGRNVIRRPRSVVFAGTTNNYQSLSDPTGARRFWPIKCGTINIPHLQAVRDQLWAEARERFEIGEQWHPTQAMVDAVKNEQEQRYQEDSWEGQVLAWADQRIIPFTLADVLAGPLNIPTERWGKSSETRVGAILTRAGYLQRRIQDQGVRKRVYYRNTAQ